MCFPSFAEDEFFEEGDIPFLETMTYELPPHDLDLSDMECVFFLAELMPYYEPRATIL